ncbi:transposase family protein [Streptomyces sioyaensis]|uniref:helix-turn-helix domain-containing protein n=1 Tax=Streptomyces sioyaensis TaxID=67364 RepID=UPI00368348BF
MRHAQHSSATARSRTSWPMRSLNSSPRWARCGMNGTRRGLSPGAEAGGRSRIETRMFIDRLLATLAHLRHRTTHDVLACWFGVDRATITRAVGEVRPLLAERGCTINPGMRLRAFAEVVDHPGTSRKLTVPLPQLQQQRDTAAAAPGAPANRPRPAPDADSSPCRPPRRRSGATVPGQAAHRTNRPRPRLPPTLTLLQLLGPVPPPPARAGPSARPGPTRRWPGVTAARGGIGRPARPPGRLRCLPPLSSDRRVASRS